MQKNTNSDLSRHYLPRQLRNLILQEYLSGRRTARQLSEEHGIPWLRFIRWVSAGKLKIVVAL